MCNSCVERWCVVREDTTVLLERTKAQLFRNDESSCAPSRLTYRYLTFEPIVVAGGVNPVASVNATAADLGIIEGEQWPVRGRGGVIADLQDDTDHCPKVPVVDYRYNPHGEEGEGELREEKEDEGNGTDVSIAPPELLPPPPQQDFPSKLVSWWKDVQAILSKGLFRACCGAIGGSPDGDEPEEEIIMAVNHTNPAAVSDDNDQTEDASVNLVSEDTDAVSNNGRTNKEEMDNTSEASTARSYSFSTHGSSFTSNSSHGEEVVARSSSHSGGRVSELRLMFESKASLGSLQSKPPTTVHRSMTAGSN